MQITIPTASSFIKFFAVITLGGVCLNQFESLIELEKTSKATNTLLTEIKTLNLETLQVLKTNTNLLQNTNILLKKNLLLNTELVNQNADSFSRLIAGLNFPKSTGGNTPSDSTSTLNNIWSTVQPWLTYEVAYNTAYYGGLILVCGLGVYGVYSTYTFISSSTASLAYLWANLSNPYSFFTPPSTEQILKSKPVNDIVNYVQTNNILSTKATPSILIDLSSKMPCETLLNTQNSSGPTNFQTHILPVTPVDVPQTPMCPLPSLAPEIHTMPILLPEPAVEATIVNEAVNTALDLLEALNGS